MAKHMTQDDRKTLEARYNAGQSVAGIARAMLPATRKNPDISASMQHFFSGCTRASSFLVSDANDITRPPLFYAIPLVFPAPVGERDNSKQLR